jgi:aquaporin Z
MKLWKKLVAEFVGTFVLVFAACGVAALTTCQWEHWSGQFIGTALAFGLVIVAMAYSIGRVSGCHINPAVSLGCLLAKRMTLVEFFAYVGAQILGGFAGAMLLFGVIKMSGFATIHEVGNACNGIIGGAEILKDGALKYNIGGVIASLLVEAVLTCIFVYVILNVTDENNNVSKKAGLIIGLTLTLVHLVGIPLTGTSVNPARSLATALGALIFNNDAEPLKVVWIFILGPLLGACLAVLLFELLHSKKEAKVEEAE